MILGVLGMGVQFTEKNVHGRGLEGWLGRRKHDGGWRLLEGGAARPAQQRQPPRTATAGGLAGGSKRREKGDRDLFLGGRTVGGRRHELNHSFSIQRLK